MAAALTSSHYAPHAMSSRPARATRAAAKRTRAQLQQQEDEDEADEAADLQQQPLEERKAQPAAATATAASSSSSAAAAYPDSSSSSSSAAAWSGASFVASALHHPHASSRQQPPPPSAAYPATASSSSAMAVPFVPPLRAPAESPMVWCAANANDSAAAQPSAGGFPPLSLPASSAVVDLTDDSPVDPLELSRALNAYYQAAREDAEAEAAEDEVDDDLAGDVHSDCFSDDCGSEPAWAEERRYMQQAAAATHSAAAAAAGFAHPYASANSSSAAAATAVSAAIAAAADAPSTAPAPPTAPAAHRQWLSEASPPGRAHPAHARTQEPLSDHDEDEEGHDDDDEEDGVLRVPGRPHAPVAGFAVPPPAACYPSPSLALRPHSDFHRLLYASGRVSSGPFCAPGHAAAAASQPTPFVSAGLPPAAAANPASDYIVWPGAFPDAETERSVREQAANAMNINSLPGAQPAPPPTSGAAAAAAAEAEVQRSLRSKRQRTETMDQVRRGAEDFAAKLAASRASSSAAAAAAVAAASAAASLSRPAAAPPAAPSGYGYTPTSAAARSDPAAARGHMESMQRRLTAEALRSELTSLDYQAYSVGQRRERVAQQLRQQQMEDASAAMAASLSDRYAAAPAAAAAAAAASPSRFAPYTPSPLEPQSHPSRQEQLQSLLQLHLQHQLQHQQHQLRMQQMQMQMHPPVFQAALHSSPMHAMSAAAAPPPPPPGLSRAQVDRFPSSIVVEGECGVDEECCVCLGEYSVGDCRRRLPCLHVFHTAVRHYTNS